MVDPLAQAIGQGTQDGQRADAEEQGGVDEALDEACALLTGIRTRGTAYPRLEPASELLDAILDAQEGPDDPADDHRSEHDEQGCRVTDSGDPLRIEQGNHIECRHDQDDEPERLGDEIAGALRKPMPDEHADSRADDDGRHVEQGPEPDHRSRLATPSSTASPDPPAATTR